MQNHVPHLDGTAKVVRSALSSVTVAKLGDESATPALAALDVDGRTPSVRMRVSTDERGKVTYTLVPDTHTHTHSYIGESTPAEGPYVVLIEDTNPLDHTRTYTLAPVGDWLSFNLVDPRDKSAAEQVELLEKFAEVGERPSAALKTLQRLRGQDGGPEMIDVRALTGVRVEPSLAGPSTAAAHTEEEDETGTAGGAKRGRKPLGSDLRDLRRHDAEEIVDSVMASIDPGGAGDEGYDKMGMDTGGRDIISRYGAELQDSLKGPHETRTFDAFGGETGMDEQGIDYVVEFGDDAGDAGDILEGEGNAADFGVTRAEMDEGERAFDEPQEREDEDWTDAEGNADEDALQKELMGEGEAGAREGGAEEAGAAAAGAAAGSKRRAADAEQAADETRGAAGAEGAAVKKARLDSARFSSDPSANIRERIREVFVAYGGRITMKALSKEFRTELAAAPGGEQFKQLLLSVLKSMSRQIAGPDGTKEYVLKN